MNGVFILCKNQNQNQKKKKNRVGRNVDPVIINIKCDMYARTTGSAKKERIK